MILNQMLAIRISRRLYTLLNTKYSKYSTSVENEGKKFDVIVVGGGHAGTEASHAAARMGARTLLVTHKKETIGVMSCNPSFGGIGKGHLMREIDALDGVCGRICDISAVQYRVLNRRKGPAVWGLRAQLDRELYRKNVQEELLKTPNLNIISGAVEDLIIERGINDSVKCCGVFLTDGSKYEAGSVVLTTGTFLKACINIGLEFRPAGRIGDEPAIGLANTLKSLGFRIGRLRTGTPPRLDKKSINFKNLDFVMGDNPSVPFSFLNDTVWLKPQDQLPCFLTYTNQKVEDLCLSTLHMNRHVREEVQGPRYCPSIESKSIKFKGRRHQIWLEPEGLNSDVIYPGGLSCTMPADKQEELIHAIPGLEKAILLQYGYGVEYEFIDSRELTPALQTKKVSGLFFAGQINGTTGYEEAAAQGIIAGINAAAMVQEKPEFLVSRAEAYIGVLIDDLTSLGTNEPYRMFTSRSEFRLYLRPDNADFRLTKKGYKIGCVSEKRFQHCCKTEEEFNKGMDILNDVSKSLYKWRSGLGINISGNRYPVKAIDLFQMGSNISLNHLVAAFPEELGGVPESRNVRLKLEIEGMYRKMQKRLFDQMEELVVDESFKIPRDIDYNAKSLALRFEEIEKLSETRPHSIAAASKIPGITPAGILRLMRYIKNHH